MKKIICLLLVITLSLGLTPNVSNAATGEDGIKNVIEKYLNTKYQLLQGGKTNELQNLSRFFYGQLENDYSNYEIGRLRYLIESNIISSTALENYNISLIYNNIELDGVDATVQVKVSANLKYNYMENIFTDELVHKITLKSSEGNWLIVSDDYLDELKMSYDINTDFSSEIVKMKHNYKSYLIENKKNKGLAPGMQDNAKENSDMQIYSEPGDSTHSYTSSYRASAVAYAKVFTDDSGSMDGSSYNNDMFKYFKENNDCQNYVSQCIWFGFGGRSSANKDFPMHSEWWADTTSTSTTWNWTGTSYFLNWVTSNYTNGNYGLQAYATTPSNISAGDYIYIPGHVLFVTKASDADGDGYVEYNELEICAHTSNRKDKNLAALYGSTPPSGMKFMRVVRVKWNEAMKM